MEDFEQHRKVLWSIAYRMLGSASDAEDVVQEAYLRTRNMPEDVTSPRAYLSTVVTRLCLDHWKSARVQRESYVGPWLPEPVSTATMPVDPSSISLAFMVLLESLSPLERAAYLLHEVFDYSHPEIARILGRDEAACRQLLSRARAHVSEQKPRFAPSLDQHRRLLESFQRACVAGDLAALEQMLASEAVSYSDGGGKIHAAQVPVRGAARVAKLYTKIFGARPADGVVAIEDINGLPSLVVRIAGVVRAVIDIETDGEQIVAVRAVVNPDKLTHLFSQASS